MNKGGRPRFAFVYDETRPDPKMKIYSKAPGDHEQDNSEQEIENIFIDEERRNAPRAMRARPEGRAKDCPEHRAFWHTRSCHTAEATNTRET